MTEKEKIRNIIELFIAWNGETEAIDVANLDSAIDFIANSLQEEPIEYNPFDDFRHTDSQEPVSNGLEAAAVEAFKKIVDNDKNSFLEIFKAGAQWKEQLLLHNAIDVRILPTNLEETEFCLNDYDEVGYITSLVKGGFMKMGDKAKLLIIKED